MMHRMTVPVLLIAAAGMLSLMGCRNQPPVEEPLAHHTNPVRIEQTTAEPQNDPETQRDIETQTDAQSDADEPDELQKRVTAIYELKPVPIPEEGWTDETLMPVVSVMGKPLEFPLPLSELLYGFHPEGDNAAYYETYADKIYTDSLLLSSAGLVMMDVFADESLPADMIPGMIELKTDWVVPLEDGSERYPVSINCVTLGSSVEALQAYLGEPGYFENTTHFQIKCNTDSLLITVDGFDDAVAFFWIRGRN